jgi:hypothetical protein
MFGEFLGVQISKDVNYWDSTRVSSHKGSNRYTYRDVLRQQTGGVFSFNRMPEHFRTAMGFDTAGQTRYHQFNKHDIDILDHRTKAKNVITFTHFFWPECDVNLRRVKRVQFVSRPEDVLLPYLMAVIKVWSSLPYTPPGMTQTSQNFNYIAPEQFIRDHVGRFALRNEPNVYKIVKTIMRDEEWEVPMINWYMLETNILDLEEYITKSYDAYFKRATNTDFYKSENWTILNVCDIIQNPHEHVDEWRDKLDMADVMDVQEIETYQKHNLAIIERWLEIPYDELKKRDFKKYILQYVRKFDKLERIKKKAGL